MEKAEALQVNQNLALGVISALLPMPTSLWCGCLPGSGKRSHLLPERPKRGRASCMLLLHVFFLAIVMVTMLLIVMVTVLVILRTTELLVLEV